MSNPFNQSPYLIDQRGFPSASISLLTVEMDRSYIDIAQKVNSRTIGIFATGNAMVTGERWFIQGVNSQQTLRQLYKITGTTAVNHGITVSQISGFTKIYGTFTDGTNWYPLPYVHPTAANQIGIYVTSTQIVFAVGGSAPTVTSGYVILEWLSNV
jgi:hypothetical protein